MSWQQLPLPPETEALAYKIRGIALAVHTEVGPGFREHVYQTCMIHALREAGHHVVERTPISVRFRDLTIHRAGEPDIIVDGQIVVELKARISLHPANRAQVLGYLKATELPVGLIFNFHAPVLLHGGTDTVVHPRYLVAAH